MYVSDSNEVFNFVWLFHHSDIETVCVGAIAAVLVSICKELFVLGRGK
jgi:hypothetical protein